MPAVVGPGGGQVGPGGGEVGPSGAFPSSGVITKTGGVITTSLAAPRAVVGPDGGLVGPAGGQVGPGDDYAVIAKPDSGVIQKQGATPHTRIQGGVIHKTPPTDDQPPVDASWSRAAGNPIIEADVAWEGDVVREPCVIQSGGLFRMWYSGGDPEAIGYATCPDDQDVGDPANWTKYAGNPILEDARKPEVLFIGGRHRMFFVEPGGDLMVTTSVDGFTGWTTPELALALSGGVAEWGSCSVLRNDAHASLSPIASSITTEVDDGMYNAWPNVVRMTDGRLMKAWTRANNHNADNSGNIVGKVGDEFPDGTVLWGAEFTIADETFGAIAISLGSLASGRVLAVYNLFDFPNDLLNSIRVRWSDDFGVTWSAGITADTGYTARVTNGNAHLIQLADDRVMMAVYGHNTGESFYSSSVLFSTDDGETWGGEVIIANGHVDGRNYYEPSLTLLDNGDIVVLMRNDESSSMFQARSTDAGATWTAPAVVFAGLSPANAIQLRNGTVVATVRSIPAFDLEVFVSFDRCASWTSAGIFDGSFHEIEYACPVETAYGVLIVYSGQPTSSISNADIRTIRAALTPWQMLVSGFEDNRWRTFFADSVDGESWTLGLAGEHYGSLLLNGLGSASGPHWRVDDGEYHIWFEATPAAGILPTNIYHSKTVNPRVDDWDNPSLALEHSGGGFEDDQVARPHIVVGTGPSASIACLFFDGQDASPEEGAIGVALAPAIGGATINGGGDLVTSTIHLVFDIGAATSDIHLLFSIEGPPISSTIHLPVDLRGAAGSTIHLPFDLEGPVTSDITFPFDIHTGPTANEVQVITPIGVITGGTYTLTFDGQTTAPIAAGANAAAVQAALEALSNVAPSDIVVTGGPLTGTELILTFGGAYAGINVPQVIVDPSDLEGTNPGAVGTTDTQGGPDLSGVAERLVPMMWRPMMVFDKAGTYLGSISRFNVTNPPVRYLRSRSITNDGAMTFNVSRHSPDLGLIKSDRLVRLQSLQGEDPWWGTMAPQLSARGVIEVTCKDPWTVLRDSRAITFEEELNDDTPATAVYTEIIARHNDLGAATGELQWELDVSGSRPFRGSIDFDGDTLTCLDKTIERSRTEIAWDSRLEGNQLVPILRVRDSFAPGAGADIFDGPDGNVTANAQVVEDPSQLVFSIRLRGQTTDLSACLPEWAHWAILDITPEVTVSVDPGPYRMREVLDESVDWGLSRAAIAAQCNAILDWLWGLYHSYVMAIHDIEGRPNHPGWSYVGPPDQYEAKINGKDSLSRRAWRTRLQLVEVRPNEPASAVMISEQHSMINLREWLIVRFNRQTGIQNVTVWAIETAAGLELIKWEVDAGGTTLYEVSGGRVIDRDTIASTGAFVDPYNTPVYDPVAKRTRQLRRIINGPFALTHYIDPADGDNSFVDLGVDAAISTVAGDGSSLIAKMYPFERFGIEDWDPRRDGIGQRLARPTVFFGQPTTRPRWHVVSFNVGGDANTSLTHGIGSADTTIEVDSILGFPDPDLDADAFPFLAAIDDGLDEELVMVLSMTGTTWTVIRGQGGTDAILHEPGAPIRRFGVEGWQGFPFPYTWPEGEQWALEDLAERSRPRIDIGVHVDHFRDDQLTIDYGSTHDVNVATEGAPGRYAGTGRAIGWSTDPGHAPSADDPTPPGGETEVILEPVT